jgi:hypothetical protein
MPCHVGEGISSPLASPDEERTTHLVEPQRPVRFEQLRRAVERRGVCPRRGGLDSDFDNIKGLRRERDGLGPGLALGPGLGLGLGLELGPRLGFDSDSGA